MKRRLSLALESLGSSRKRPQFTSGAGILALLAVSVLIMSCGGSSSSSSNNNPAPPSVPSIQNINNSTDPSSPINLPIEINGSGFQGSPGKVVFTQASSGIAATVTPNAAGWTDHGVVANVPKGDGTNSFTVPGTISVAVTTSGGTSNAISLTLAQTLAFNVNSLGWTTTTPLPVALTGLRAVAVPIDSLKAFVVVTGGFDGAANSSNVYCNTISPTGAVGPSWTTIPTNILPQTVAYHAMVEADSTNSPVSTGSHFIYVLGGQVTSGGTPGGTTNVYMAGVDSNSGAVGTWTQLASSLPVPLVGAAAALSNGYVYVVGGLNADSTPSANVYSAPVKSDGTLGAWTQQSANPYPLAISFATEFGYAGRLYVLGGDPTGSISPGAQGSPGINNVNFATILNGVVGTWTTTSSTIVKRKKQATWTAFGQVIDAEGVYDGNSGSQELEASSINADGTLMQWTGIAAGDSPGANVYNAAAIVSPLQSPASTPRFLLLGGQGFATIGIGSLSSQVFFNNAP
ncbi:MAG TPA: hypothetical protein VFQ24_01775 [Terriglobia bacterium]|nr:hypothetical protein [Terriglobia bacterium]